MASNKLPWARNLSKHQLGGVIFGTTNKTMNECLDKQLFGLPASHILYVKNIEQGLPLFLFNYSDRKLYGVYEAASSGKINIDSYAWTSDGSERTRLPAQVQIIVRLQCQALDECQFKPIIADNYYTPTHFRFELDHAQTSNLILILYSLAVAPRTFVHKNPPIWKPLAKKFTSDNRREESKASEPQSLADDFANSLDSVGTSSSNDIRYLDGDTNNQLAEASLGNQIVEDDEKDLIYMKLKELALSYEYATASQDDVEFERDINDNSIPALGKENGESYFDFNDYPTVVTQLRMEVEELQVFKLEQTHKMECLQKKLGEAEREIQCLKRKCMVLESPDEYNHLKLNESIFLVGGYDGESWSSALHSFLPSADVLKPLKSMSCIRAYSSVASLNGELYVFGGGISPVWYDTVESYNVVGDKWTIRPPMKTKKGCLAGAALNGKVFAVGGGNGVECFSDVEMFDLDIGRWISARSMIDKRFSLAAVELNGALYAVGGYDGKEYLKSAERFDPREHSWSKIGSMDKRRGCHTLAVLNEKIYALGGYDGESMVASTEIYDPRLNTWMAGEPMNCCRGYLAAAVVNNDTIYVIGGHKGDEEEGIVDMIECYKEGGGQGWEATNLSAIGKRCFAPAIVFGAN